MIQIKISGRSSRDHSLGCHCNLTMAPSRPRPPLKSGIFLWRRLEDVQMPVPETQRLCRLIAISHRIRRLGVGESSGVKGAIAGMPPRHQRISSLPRAITGLRRGPPLASWHIAICEAQDNPALSRARHKSGRGRRLLTDMGHNLISPRRQAKEYPRPVTCQREQILS